MPSNKNAQSGSSSGKEKKTGLKTDLSDISFGVKAAIWMMGTTPKELEKIAKKQKADREQGKKPKKKKTALKTDLSDISFGAKAAIWMVGTTPEKLEKIAKKQKAKRDAKKHGKKSKDEGDNEEVEEEEEEQL